MADRPILFSASMVQALLREARQPGTGKTQTRRILRLPKWASTDPDDIEFGGSGTPEVICRNTGCLAALPLPYAVGDRLWVKETWRPIPDALSECTGPEDLRFAASVDEAEWAINKWRPSLFMSRWGSRLTLVVTGVRIERLNDMSPADAIAEGIQDLRTPEHSDFGIPGLVNAQHPVRAFWLLWDHINGEGAWLRNPWVVAVSFTVHARNIDQLAPVAEAAE